jgi:hypothetical protein
VGTAGRATQYTSDWAGLGCQRGIGTRLGLIGFLHTRYARAPFGQRACRRIGEVGESEEIVKSVSHRRLERERE